MAPSIKRTDAAAEKRRTREKLARAAAKAAEATTADPAVPPPAEGKPDPAPAPAPAPPLADQGDIPALPPPPKLAAPPPLAPPPAVPPATSARSSSWRAAYGDTGQGGSREATCVLVATALIAGMRRASERITAAGVTPVFAPEQLAPDKSSPMYRAAVLTADDLLPRSWSITPAVELTFAGTYLTLQLWGNLGAIREAEARNRRTGATVTPLRAVPAEPPPAEEVKADRPTDEPPPPPAPSSPAPAKPVPEVRI